jgi:endonuclease-3
MTASRVLKPLNIPVMFRRIEQAIAPYAEAAMFDLAKQGYDTLFQQLIACILSIRTLDEVSLPVALQLFKRAPDPRAIARLPIPKLDRLIARSTFHGQKAHTIHDIAVRTVEEFDGTLPCDAKVLTSFRGVGPKCANLALGIACGAAEIAVDVHVHRVTGRWGYTDARSADQAREQLEAKLPKRYWVAINRLLVPFGKHICTGHLPKCSTCPVREYCPRIGVTAHR